MPAAASPVKRPSVNITAFERGAEYTDALKANKKIVGDCVTENLYDRHILRLFVV